MIAQCPVSRTDRTGRQAGKRGVARLSRGAALLHAHHLQQEPYVVRLLYQLRCTEHVVPINEQQHLMYPLSGLTGKSSVASHSLK